LLQREDGKREEGAIRTRRKTNVDADAGADAGAVAGAGVIFTLKKVFEKRGPSNKIITNRRGWWRAFVD